MESPARYATHQSKKRVFPESSSSLTDPDVVEISAPSNWNSKSKSRSKRKEVAHYEVINIEPDDDPELIVFVDKEVNPSYKGKQSADTSYNNMSALRETHGVQPPQHTAVQGAHDSLGTGFSDHDFVYDDDYIDLFQDGSIFDEEYTFLQAKFDSIDIPTGIEAPLPWFKDPAEKKKKVVSVSSSSYQISEVQLDSSGIGLSHSGGENWISPSSSSWQTQVADKQPYVAGFSFLPAFPNSSPNKNKSDATIISHNLSSKMSIGACSLSSKLPSHPPEFSSSERQYNVSASSGHYPANDDMGSVEIPSQRDTYLKRFYPYCLQNKIPGKVKLISNSPGFSTSNLSHSVNDLKSMQLGSFSFYQPRFPVDGIFKAASDDFHLSPEAKFPVNGAVSPAEVSIAPSGSISSTKDHDNQDDIMKSFQVFKQFDTVEDYSDHHYSKSGSSVMQQPKKWAKAIQEEWKILEKDLPDTIFVRVYESRMDLLRAVIVGAQGTPYHDGLFFFDIFFPSSYPSVPPHVYYHSGGLRINPNLYDNGKVCLSLLNTWSGSGNEMWMPNSSTMLQVLVSIQALILNEKPYFNEPGHIRWAGTTSGEQNSRNYSENAFILSLKTMVYTMRRPPKHFEEFVIGHFCKHAQDILGACKVYIEEGIQVGSVTEEEVKNVQPAAKKCSPHFKGDVVSHITMIVQAFVNIGAKDCNKYLSLAQQAEGCEIKAGVNCLDISSNSIWMTTGVHLDQAHKSKYKKYK